MFNVQDDLEEILTVKLGQIDEGGIV